MAAKEILYMTLAVGLTVFGSIGNALGYVLQKKGHLIHMEQNEIREIQDDDPKPLIYNKTWAIGFIVCLIGSILTAAAFKFGAQSVLAPLSALVLVCNAILANRILGEPFTRNNAYGIVLVIIGSSIAVIFGPKSSTAPISLAYVESCWRNHVFLIFFILLTLLLLIDYILVKGFEKKDVNIKSIEMAHTIAYGANFVMISYISIAAYCGSVNVLFMKSLMIIMGSFNISYFNNYLFYTTAIGIVLVNIILEYFRQLAIKFFDATYVVPIFQVQLILGSSTMGAIFFGEFDQLTNVELILFISAIFITVTGVAVLAFEIGATYKTMLKKINSKMPESFRLTKKEESLSIRSKARLSFTKRQKRQPQLAFPAFYGATSAMRHYHMSRSTVIDESVFRTIATPPTRPHIPHIAAVDEYKSWNSPRGKKKLMGFPDTEKICQTHIKNNMKSNRSMRNLHLDMYDYESETLVNDKAGHITPVEDNMMYTETVRLKDKVAIEEHHDRVQMENIKSFSIDDFDEEQLSEFGKIMEEENTVYSNNEMLTDIDQDQ